MSGNESSRLLDATRLIEQQAVPISAQKYAGLTLQPAPVYLGIA